MTVSPASRPARQTLSFETVLFSAIALGVIVATVARFPALPVTAQAAVLGLLVAVLGIPHGALDPLIARRAGLWSRPLGFVLFNLGYIAMIILVIGVWELAPTVSLIGFLLVSGVHFGADWSPGGGLPVRALALRTVTGVGLLTLPACVHFREVSTVYETLAGPGGLAVAQAQAWLGPVAIAGMGIGVLAAVRSRPSDAVEIALAAALALVAPPLVFFAVYFCALHSARHLRHGFAVERAAGRLAVPVTVVYSVVPLAASAILLVIFTNGRSGDTATTGDVILRLVFIGLAALTVPHMALVAFSERPAPVRAERSRITS